MLYSCTHMATVGVKGLTMFINHYPMEISYPVGTQWLNDILAVAGVTSPWQLPA